MSSDRRPGGLTALAVLNFIWGGVVAITMLVGMGGAAASGQMAKSEEPIVVTTTDSAGQTKTETLNPEVAKTASTFLWVFTLITGVLAALLIASGVGYLGQKKFLGRTLGNAYALVSLAWSGLSIYQSGFGIWTMIFMVYPLLTLLLINTTFKPDLVN